MIGMKNMATEDPREFLFALRETIAYETDEVEAESLIVTPGSDFHHYLVGQVSAHRETLYRLDAYLARTRREAWH